MSETAFIDEFGDDVPDKTVEVWVEHRFAIVKYPKPDGGCFRLKFVMKPNPIGFHCRLPGDA